MERDWFSRIRALRGLPPGAAEELRETGFVRIPGPVASYGLARLAAAYDAAVASAGADEVAVGSSTTRVHGLVNRGQWFDELYVYPPVIEACCQVIGRPFKLSTLLARTLRPHTRAQALHADFPRDADGWPMVGFILMLDEFRVDNGATRFVPGSHDWLAVPDDVPSDPSDYREGQITARGPAGSLIIYNGSVLHGHTANSSDEPRRSIQGAYIRRDAQSVFDLASRMRPETLERISPLARYLLAV